MIRLVSASILAACGWLAAAPSVCAADPCFGFSYLDIVSDRTRLIQGSCVIVAFGIALLWWKK